jgi:hypothetical protein
VEYWSCDQNQSSRRELGNLQDINAAIEATHTVDAASSVMFSGILQEMVLETTMYCWKAHSSGLSIPP